MNKKFTRAIAFLSLFSFSHLAFAATITVTTNADVIASDGECSLREAIINSNDDAETHTDCEAGSAMTMDSIVLSAGTYCLDNTAAEDDTALNGDLDIADSLAIEGAGSGLTILDAGSSSNSFAAGCTTELNERILHVTEADGSDPDSVTITLSGLTLRGGYATHATADVSGGGLYMSTTASSLNLTDVVFSENTAAGVDGKGEGGAIWVGVTSDLNFENVELASNTVSSEADSAVGGGIYVGSTSVSSFVGFLAQDNDASSTTAGQNQLGGAVYLSGFTTTTFTNATFNNNSVNLTDADTVGGAIYVVQGDELIPFNTTLTIQSSTFVNNSASNGGAIGNPVVAATTITVENSVFAENVGTVFGPTCTGTIDAGTNNFADDTSACTFTEEEPNAADPLLIDLTDNGGDLQTFAIDSTSPLFDAGDCADYTVTTDQRGEGFAREFGAACDVGAFELQEYTDVDGDGFYLVAADSTHLDCDDADAAINPDATDICDGVDNNCDGDSDEDFTDLGDSCSVGVGACVDDTGEMACSADGLSTECSGTAGTESVEVCDDDIDNDCDGDTDTDDADCVVSGDDDDDTVGDDDNDDTAASSGGCQLANGPAHSNAVVVLTGMGLLALLSFRRRQMHY